MILRNPTDKDITVKINGHSYTAPAMDTIELPDAAGLHWVKNIHQFMEILPGGEKIVEPPAPAPVVDADEDLDLADDEEEDEAPL